MEQSIKTNREIQSEMYKMINEVHTEVMGNPQANRPSYGERLNTLEKNHKNQSKIYLFISAISSGIAFGIHTVINLLKN